MKINDTTKLFNFFVFIAFVCTGCIADGRVVGGNEATLGEWPWQARLSISIGQDNFLCGGSLIDENWILTAAHCIENAIPENVTVSLGDYRRSENEDTEQVLNVTQIIPHPNYDGATYDNDIALLELETSVQLTDAVQVVVLGTSNDPVESGTMATITGWGRTSEGGSTSDVLMEAEVPIVTNNTCNEAYSDIQITDNMLCAGFDEGGVDTCNGDSGGPLIVRDSDDWMLAGIVSFGIGCARPDLYGVYTRVSRYNSWINAQLDDEPFEPLELGEQLNSDGQVINCVSWSEDRIDCFVRGDDEAMHHRWWDGHSWGGWESLGGVLTSAPECVSWSEDRIDCFVRGGDEAMHHRWWDGHSWGGWESLGGVLTSAPECVSWGENRIDCFVRGGDEAMHHRWWNGSSWGEWEYLGGVLTSAPECVSWGENRIDCFVRGGDKAMHHRWWNGSSWGEWEYLDGVLTSAPECVSWGENRIDCFV
ncbi:trypsin-like serine protease, partial [Anaerolineales bacterium HSG24]|nr:trypsin-like serine protease [Anaerolineales bacterium HSG24]